MHLARCPSDFTGFRSNFFPRLNKTNGSDTVFKAPDLSIPFPLKFRLLGCWKGLLDQSPDTTECVLSVATMLFDCAQMFPGRGTLKHTSRPLCGFRQRFKGFHPALYPSLVSKVANCLVREVMRLIKHIDAFLLLWQDNPASHREIRQHKVVVGNNHINFF